VLRLDPIRAWLATPLGGSLSRWVPLKAERVELIDGFIVERGFDACEGPW
jgi:hypothetical protein